MTHCEKCNIVHVNLECPLCAAKATIEKLRIVVIEKLRIVVKAAPVMLEALKKIVRECEWNEPDRGWPDEDNSEKNKITAIAQAAIDAAEGVKDE